MRPDTRANPQDAEATQPRMGRISPASALQLFLRWVILTISLFAAYLVLPGIRIGANAIVALVVMALLLGLVNALVGPLLAQFSFGPLMRTASVFMFAANAVILWLVAGVARWLFKVEIFVDSFVWAFLGAVIISAVSELLTGLLPPDRIAQALLVPNVRVAPIDARTVAKRLLAVVAMMLSLVLCVANLAGIVGLWVARGPVTHNLETWLGRIEPVLETADNTFVRVNGELRRARSFVGRVETSVTQLGTNVVNNRLILTVISNTVGEQLVQSVVRAGDTVSSVGEAVRSFNNTLEAINALPFATVPTLPDDVRAIVERVANLRAEVQALRDRVIGIKADVVGGAVAEVTDRTARIDALLTEIEARTTRYEQQVKRARQAVALARSEVAGWITLAAIGATLFLLWIAFSQAVVFLYAWSLAGFKPLFTSTSAPVRVFPDGS